ncbi:MAG: hypothetical protein Q6373_025605 [Candidatus Sigynarchaeota archaeon]
MKQENHEREDPGKKMGARGHVARAGGFTTFLYMHGRAVCLYKRQSEATDVFSTTNPGSMEPFHVSIIQATLRLHMILA